MKDKILGVIYAMALGDAMGMPSELWGRTRVQNFFGEITEFLDGPAENDVAFNYKKGQYTDDTAQALVILDSIFSTDFKPNSKDIAIKMLAWADKENAFENNILGPTSKVALGNFKDGKDSKKFTDKSLSNGSAMRIPPIGCLFSSKDKEKLVDYVYNVSKVTHTSDVTIAGASMIAMAIASALENNDFEKIIDDVFEVEKLGYIKGAETFSPRLSARLEIALNLAKKYKDEEESFAQKLYDTVGTGVCIIESVPTAIAVAYYFREPNKSAIFCANLGGDTDTIGAMATAICGAYTGIEGICDEYIKILDQQNHVDFNYYADILEKGRDLLL